MKNLLLIILGASVLVSCQKVIDVELNEASPKYVIEGGLNDVSATRQIKITKTRAFSEDNTFESVSNAFVTIGDNAGNLDTLKYVSEGIYKASSALATPGRVYALTVKIGKETFFSTSQMPEIVKLDTLYITDFLGFGDTIKLANIGYKDPAGVKNYYRFNSKLNDKENNDIIILNDQFNDGKKAKINLSYAGDNRKTNEGDTLTIEMQSIDKDVYNYFFTLNQTIRQNSAAPTNPQSNISGGALGYFNAYISQVKKIKLK